MVDLNLHPWFSLIQARLLPETGERVNVALLVADRSQRLLVFDQGLPRLAGILSAADREIVEGVLEWAQSSVRNGAALDEIGFKLAPQLEIGAARELYTRIDEKTVALLRRSYLVAPAEGRAAGYTKVVQETIESLAHTVSSLVPATGPKPLSRVRPDTLYPEHAESLFRATVPTVAWAVRDRHVDWLIDGVHITAGNVEPAIRAATVRINRAFWHYQEGRARIQKLTSRSVKTVGVLLDGASVQQTEDVIDARRYVAHIWQAHADYVVHSDKPVELEDLKREFAW